MVVDTQSLQDTGIDGLLSVR